MAGEQSKSLGVFDFIAIFIDIFMNLNQLLKHLLTEQIEEDMDEIANYPKGFDVFKLRTIKDYYEKLNYIDRSLKPLGQGSSRAVFVGDKQTALKVAVNAKGLAQNKLEVQVYNKARSKPYTDLITNVFEYDEDYLWIESERASPGVGYNTWIKHTGVNFSSWIVLLNRYIEYSKCNPKVWKGAIDRMTPVEKEVVSSQLFQHVIAMLKDFKMVVSGDLHDFGNPDNWGTVKRNGKQCLVVIDYGLDTKVYDKWYGHNNW